MGFLTVAILIWLVAMAAWFLVSKYFNPQLQNSPVPDIHVS